jgi:hypothetical protein
METLSETTLDIALNAAPKANSAELILKLYELRRDPLLRQAREWYFTEFMPESADDIVALLTKSFDGSRHFRMVVTYWDMAATLVNHGGIDASMFLDANTEHVGVYGKIAPFLEEVRTKFRPGYLRQLETLMNTIPNLDATLEGRRKLLKGWAEAAKKGDLGFK